MLSLRLFAFSSRPCLSKWEMFTREMLVWFDQYSLLLEYLHERFLWSRNQGSFKVHSNEHGIMLIAYLLISLVKWPSFLRLSTHKTGRLRIMWLQNRCRWRMTWMLSSTIHEHSKRSAHFSLWHKDWRSKDKTFLCHPGIFFSFSTARNVSAFGNDPI